MKNKLKVLLIHLVLIQILFPTRYAMADIGPKPSLDFTFTQEFSGDQVSIIHGTLLQCEQSDCSNAAPLEKVGPQSFGCESDSCHAVAYGFSPYSRLKIQFSDGKTRLSNIFETGGFSEDYLVTIRQEDLLVEIDPDADSNLTINPRSLWTFAIICPGCLLMLLIIAIVGVIILIVRRVSKR